MIPLVELALAVALASALVAVVFGQVLTRSVVAGYAAIASFGLAGLAAGGGVVALCVVIFGLLTFAILQLFGWMLVDVDHDHLPAPSARRTVAQAVALATFAAGLVWLGRRALRAGELAAPAFSPSPSPLPPTAPIDRVVAFDPGALGAFFFGGRGELAILLGCLLAAALLTALSLLRDEGVDAG